MVFKVFALHEAICVVSELHEGQIKTLFDGVFLCVRT